MHQKWLFGISNAGTEYCLTLIWVVVDLAIKYEVSKNKKVM